MRVQRIEFLPSSLVSVHPAGEVLQVFVPTSDGYFSTGQEFFRSDIVMSHDRNLFYALSNRLPKPVY
ncbi:MAG: hypothetical protein DMG88_00095 [Acidobacteria bacterium]|nr:MAG: hypothetical protein DMG88_00095 [Acidobacteriota bacterium]